MHFKDIQCVRQLNLTALHDDCSVPASAHPDGCSAGWVGRGIDTCEHGQAGPRGSHAFLPHPPVPIPSPALSLQPLPHDRATLPLREWVGP